MPWRSTLYPDQWEPGYSDDAGRFLHDFSRAGYHSGDIPVPALTSPVTDVTRPPYNADSSGKTDTTAAIQKALDTIGLSGGGIVYLPPGSYRISPQADNNSALLIRDDHVILRGAGPDRTFLFNTSVKMRGKRVISLEPRTSAWWNTGSGDPSGIALSADLPQPSSIIPVTDVSSFAVGELVAIRNTITQSYIDRLGMTGKWQAGNPANRPLAYCRRIVSIDTNARTLTVDIPVRGFLFTTDRARVVKTSGRMLSEVGLEDFSIGMVQHPDATLDEGAYDTPGTAAYDTHGSIALSLSFVENAWVRRVHTYAPAGNAPKVHILSNALRLWNTRLVTVSDCDFKFPQYRGGGGNGYLYCLNAQDNLIRDCRAEGGRHNYDFGTMASSGNVILDCTAKDGDLASDFHMYLSLANLIDNLTCDGDFIEARALRPWGAPMHGVTTTQSVFWNTRGLRYAAKHLGDSPALVYSHQFGDGYVIGTRGPAHDVDSDDFVEGVGTGDSLQPRSLYLDQLSRRLARESTPPSP
ncbi:hypothetical protein FPL22_08470 [Rariglobus hedericola]|uniref:Rhamnogalacturonase A/B/Epimerase-like pectate lyase domain-containing protein n=1 Tax=Rariglobus hedericola TaxID=2597822 RepID=A0A556QSZ6_9BACT|nr:hypothetical protein FPL22_08470 [Rariglobus hedericola]